MRNGVHALANSDSYKTRMAYCGPPARESVSSYFVSYFQLK